MSLFLGPIHYWLYDKIRNQEDLTEKVAVEAKEHGWIEDSKEYTKVLPKLDEMIDESNIHGWLQSQIIDAESRFARLITDVLAKGADFNELSKLAFDFGKENKAGSLNGVEDIYQYFEDFFVNGMPCDHVNQVTGRTDTELSWEMIQDIHAQYWVDGDVENYYRLRKAVMDGMLDGSECEVKMSDPYHYQIQITV